MTKVPVDEKAGDIKTISYNLQRYTKQHEHKTPKLELPIKILYYNYL